MGDVPGSFDTPFSAPSEMRSLSGVQAPVSRGSNYHCYRIGDAAGPIACVRVGGVFGGVPPLQ